MNKIQPIKKRVILQPSDSLMRGSIFIPENMVHRMSTACKVIARGPDVHQTIKVGDVVLCKVGVDRSNTIDDTTQFWSTQDSIYAVIKKNNIIFPIGRTVLIKRDVMESKEGFVVVPENRKTQSLDGWVVRTGIYYGHTRVNGISQGSKVRLTGWEPHMIQIQLEDGSEGLIVNDKDILFKYE